MKLRESLIALLGFCLASGLQAREFADIYTECGLGAMIAPNNEVVAAITNITWDFGTTAMISNAASPDTCKGGEGSTAAFIFDAYPNLEKDLARGSGEHLTALLDIAGCEVAAQSDVAATIRQDFRELVRAEDYSNKTRYENAEGLFDIVVRRVSQDYSAACTISS